MKLKSRGPLIIGMGGAFLVILLVAGLIIPKASAVKDKQRELDEARRQENTLSVQLSELKAMARDAGKTRRALTKIDEQVPGTAEVPTIIDLLTDVAVESKVDFFSIAPGTPTSAPGTPVSTIPTQITLVGRYFALHDFLLGLERLNRVSKVTGVSISVGSDTAAGAAGPQLEGWQRLQASLTADFYTTDASAGPGSIPGHTDASQAAPAPAPAPSPQGV